MTASSVRNCIAFAMAALPVAMLASAAQGAGDYSAFIEQKSMPLVTVKFVLKLKMGPMGDQETEGEVTGVTVNDKGLVLCSNNQLGGITRMMRRFMRGSVTATPTDIKVLIGDDTEGVEADLIARDTELDLAWIRIKEPHEEPYPYVDFSSGAEPAAGASIMAVRRMGKYFGRANVIEQGHIGGITRKPRTLYVPAGDLSGSLGLPIYQEDGKIVGFTVMQMPDEEDSDPMSALSNMSSMQDMMGGFILPAAEVVKATQRAMETAATGRGVDDDDAADDANGDDNEDGE